MAQAYLQTPEIGRFFSCSASRIVELARGYWALLASFHVMCWTKPVRECHLSQTLDVCAKLPRLAKPRSAAPQERRTWNLSPVLRPARGYWEDLVTRKLAPDGAGRARKGAQGSKSKQPPAKCLFSPSRARWGPKVGRHRMQACGPPFNNGPSNRRGMLSLRPIPHPMPFERTSFLRQHLNECF